MSGHMTPQTHKIPEIMVINISSKHDTWLKWSVCICVCGGMDGWCGTHLADDDIIISSSSTYYTVAYLLVILTNVYTLDGLECPPMHPLSIYPLSFLLASHAEFAMLSNVCYSITRLIYTISDTQGHVIIWSRDWLITFMLTHLYDIRWFDIWVFVHRYTNCIDMCKWFTVSIIGRHELQQLTVISDILARQCSFPAAGRGLVTQRLAIYSS